MKKFKISFVLEGEFEDEKHAAKTVLELMEGSFPLEREMDGGIAASHIEASEVKDRKDHQVEIYKLVQNTLDFCGNTFEAVKDYCRENNLRWADFEEVRFNATMDFNKKTEVKK